MPIKLSQNFQQYQNTYNTMYNQFSNGQKLFGVEQTSIQHSISIIETINLVNHLNKSWCSRLD